MDNDPDVLYSALAARDRRFDGVFFVGVTSTGIYCRPVCTARTPRAANCRFFTSAAGAERAGFRPCLRCRPELAPGNAPLDGPSRVARRALRRIEEGLADDGAGLERVAADVHVSPRHLRRVVRNELGVTPMDLVLTRRLLLAKQLLTETRLPVTEIAYASGFSSLRRFNDAFLNRYRMPPTRLRREATGGAGGATSDGPITLRLEYRPPFDWTGLLDFFAMRALRGVEYVEGPEYGRIARVGTRTGVIRVRPAPRGDALDVEIARSLTSALPSVLRRLRHLFDLDARPDIIGAHLRRDPRLAWMVDLNPGRRVPGTFDGFELAVAAILGQQITVAAASRLAGRVAEAFGEPVDAGDARLTRLGATPDALAAADPANLSSLGIAATRARCLVALAAEVAAGRIRLEPDADAATTVEHLRAIPGIGPWTAQYIAMRALAWPDAFPKEDVVLRRKLGGLTTAEAEAASRAWRPWRSYAVLHIWRTREPG